MIDAVHRSRHHQLCYAIIPRIVWEFRDFFPLRTVRLLVHTTLHGTCNASYFPSRYNLPRSGAGQVPGRASVNASLGIHWKMLDCPSYGRCLAVWCESSLRVQRSNNQAEKRFSIQWNNSDILRPLESKDRCTAAQTSSDQCWNASNHSYQSH